MVGGLDCPQTGDSQSFGVVTHMTHSEGHPLPPRSFFLDNLMERPFPTDRLSSNQWFPIFWGRDPKAPTLKARAVTPMAVSLWVWWVGRVGQSVSPNFFDGNDEKDLSTRVDLPRGGSFTPRLGETAVEGNADGSASAFYEPWLIDLDALGAAPLPLRRSNEWPNET